MSTTGLLALAILIPGAKTGAVLLAANALRQRRATYESGATRCRSAHDFTRALLSGPRVVPVTPTKRWCGPHVGD